MSDSITAFLYGGSHVYSQLDQREDAVWGLLLASGCLEVVSYEECTETPDGRFMGKRVLIGGKG